MKIVLRTGASLPAISYPVKNRELHVSLVKTYRISIQMIIKIQKYDPYGIWLDIQGSAADCLG